MNTASGKLCTFFLDLFNLVRRLSFSILSLGLGKVKGWSLQANFFKVKWVMAPDVSLASMKALAYVMDTKKRMFLRPDLWRPILSILMSTNSFINFFDGGRQLLLCLKLWSEQNPVDICSCLLFTLWEEIIYDRRILKNAIHKAADFA